jgi:hypothetical protein
VVSGIGFGAAGCCAGVATWNFAVKLAVGEDHLLAARLDLAGLLGVTQRLDAEDADARGRVRGGRVGAAGDQHAGLVADDAHRRARLPPPRRRQHRPRLDDDGGAVEGRVEDDRVSHDDDEGHG